MLTAIIAWAFERSDALLAGFLDRALPQWMLTQHEREFRGSDAPDIRVEEPAYLDGDRYRFDLIVEWGEFQVVVEFKVVPAALAVSQLEIYHRVLSADGREYAIIVVSPDATSAVQTILSSLSIGRERTFHLPWGELYDLAVKVQSDEEPSGDSTLAHEVKVAIEMAPGLKPFRGFGEAALTALQNMDEADKQIGELFTAIRGILTAPQPRGLGLSFRKTHAEDPPAFRLPSSIWDEYVDPDLSLPENVPNEEVILGPWIRLAGNGSIYSAYLETTSPRAAVVFQRALTERSESRKSIEETFEARFPGIPLSITVEATQAGLYANLPLENPMLLAAPTSDESPLVSTTASVLRFFREQVTSSALSGYR